MSAICRCLKLLRINTIGRVFTAHYFITAPSGILPENAILKKLEVLCIMLRSLQQWTECLFLCFLLQYLVKEYTIAADISQNSWNTNQKNNKFIKNQSFILLLWSYVLKILIDSMLHYFVT